MCVLHISKMLYIYGNDFGKYIQNNLQKLLKNNHFLQQKMQKNITSVQKFRAARARLHKSIKNIDFQNY